MQNISLPILCTLNKFSMNIKILKQALSRNQNENTVIYYLRLATIPATIGMWLSLSPNLDLRRAVN